MSDHDLFDAANAKLDAGEYSTAFALFMRSFESGDVWALNSLGYCFDHGLGVRKNKRLAAFWYHAAAKLDDCAACANLAICYRETGNTRQAKTWFRKAIALQDHDSAVDLAKMLLQSGSKRKKSAALKYLRIAAASNNITEDGREEALRLQAQLTVQV